MEKSKKKGSSHAPGPYSFCPKHNVFFASCGCKQKTATKKEMDIEPIEEEK